MKATLKLLLIGLCLAGSPTRSFADRIFDPPHTPFKTRITDSAPVAIVSADLNGDSYEDLVVAGPGLSAAVTVLLGHEDGFRMASDFRTGGIYPHSMSDRELRGLRPVACRG